MYAILKGRQLVKLAIDLDEMTEWTKTRTEKDYDRVSEVTLLRDLYSILEDKPLWEVDDDPILGLFKGLTEEAELAMKEFVLLLDEPISLEDVNRCCANAVDAAAKAGESALKTVRETVKRVKQRAKEANQRNKKNNL